MDIVRAAQYNPGKCYEAHDNLRRGRNEHPVFGQALKNLKPAKVWHQIEKEQITCAKIIGYPEWIAFLSERFDVRMVAPCRDKVSRNKSAADMLLHIESDKAKVKLQEKLLDIRDACYMNFRGKKMTVGFGYLVSKDLNTFKRLRDFLGYDGPAEDLMRPVDAGRVKFNGKET